MVRELIPVTAVCLVGVQIVSDPVALRERWIEYFEQLYQVDPPTVNLDVAEQLKAGGEPMAREFHAVLAAIWQSDTVPSNLLRERLAMFTFNDTNTLEWKMEYPFRVLKRIRTIMNSHISPGLRHALTPTAERVSASVMSRRPSSGSRRLNRGLLRGLSTHSLWFTCNI
ncbi:uncharacterized protein [Penaeus vannamei]|uniref:uncharacterized protein n=1 Tax=Penaeus vannamei TaxID=6689 RepID=UPI00387F9CEC